MSIKSVKGVPLVEESLDPQDWEGMRALGHRMVDDVIDHLRDIRQHPVWQHAPDEVKAHFQQPLPLGPQSPGSIYEEFRRFVLPYPIGNLHPRFWGWVFGTGTIMGAYASLLAAAMNTNAGDLDHHSANHVEKQVLDWCKAMLGFPASASGLLTSGCSAANLIGLAVARNDKAERDLRQEGMHSLPRPMVLYASEEVHGSVLKAVQLLGLGATALRLIPVNHAYQIDLPTLEAAIVRDRGAGLHPFCVVGAAGTVNTGASDDLDGLADLCHAHDLWLHVDGAFGAWAALVPEYQTQVAGMERADSLAFDLHKWMYMPYEIGCVLVREAAAHRRTFASSAVYLSRETSGRGLTGGDLPWLTDLGFQLSRSFRALKAWMSLKEHGRAKYERLVRQNIEQARYLAEKVAAHPELELAAPAPLNIVCFRYLKPGLAEGGLRALNQAILEELQERGLAVVSGTTLRDRYVLRVGHTNHRTRREDFDFLVAAVVAIGRQLAERMAADGSPQVE